MTDRRFRRTICNQCASENVCVATYIGANDGKPHDNVDGVQDWCPDCKELCVALDPPEITGDTETRYDEVLKEARAKRVDAVENLREAAQYAVTTLADSPGTQAADNAVVLLGRAVNRLTKGGSDGG